MAGGRGQRVIGLLVHVFQLVLTLTLRSDRTSSPFVFAPFSISFFVFVFESVRVVVVVVHYREYMSRVCVVSNCLLVLFLDWFLDWFFLTLILH